MSEHENFNEKRILIGNPGDSFGIVGFLIGLIGFFALIPSIFAIILGTISKDKSRESKMSETWGKLSTTIGYIGIIVFLIIIVLCAYLFIDGQYKINKAIQTQNDSSTTQYCAELKTAQEAGGNIAAGADAANCD